MYTTPLVLPRPAEGARQKRVLIVEDDPVSAQVLAKRLDLLGFLCTGIAQDADTALDMAKTALPDLVLLDIRIPGSMDGIGLCDVIQRRHHIPVILVTAYTQEEITTQAAAVNPYGLLFKPVDFSQLRVAMETALRKRAEEDLQESSERFRATFEQAAVGMCHVLTDGRFLRVNEQLCRLLGFSRPELAGSALRAVTHEDDLEMADAAIGSILSGHIETHTFEMRLARKDGSLVWTLVTLSPARGASGDIDYLIAVIQDVTQSHRAAEELRDNEETLRNILNGIRAAIFIIDPESKVILDANAIAEDLLGLSREEFLGKSCCTLDWQDKRGREISGLCRFRDNSLVNEEMRLKKADGRVVPIIKTVIPGMRRGRTVLYEIVFDISERKALERRLSIAQKLESVGELAAGVAHEINTPIQYIGDNLHYLQSAYADLHRILDAALSALALPSVRDAAGEALREVDAARTAADLDFLAEEVPKSLEQSLEGVERVASIVRAMKKFSHPGGEEKTAVDINKAVENTILVARNEWKYVADVVTDLDADLPPVHCLPGDFNQVILNVLINAAHAIGDAVRGTSEKGRITIVTRREGRLARLSITDTGTGIPEKNREKIFDPFFTTKEIGRGTGQGLAIVHDIVVEKHDGTIDVESEVGKGATFHIRIPIGGDHGCEAPK
ncbi:PAS domain S-box protein [Desulfovibrio sulfodismutans]|uniref:histidine kinase n=1 Tax=Desulfolutivibrio sulfodismutans TaxID=63561 RepID=A0A7K3NLL5_9BACT|nr:PAS domain S-box protein [Desulfolutivibrio sulfodismutans]NDY56079.1 PAS domain S-box protein [Desulfolutivibrio sulfodismutans]QLA12334.1 PAS domain S-box protein [Desulfolutivibrio sulfodismutans DSM 3696]